MNNEQLTISFIGAGRAGVPVAAAFSAAGHHLGGVVARSEQAQGRVVDVLGAEVPLLTVEQAAKCSVIVVAVPDDAIYGVAEQLSEYVSAHAIVLHISGSHGLSVLQPVADAGAMIGAIHPAMTFSGTSLDVESLRGAAWAVTANPVLLPLLHMLIDSTGGTPFSLADEQRSAYHAGLVHGANHLTTLITQALQVLRDAGVDDPAAVLGPLAKTALQATLDREAQALTGPVARGDVGTVKAHLATLEGKASAPTYAALAEATAALACRSERITPDQAAELVKVLRST